MFQSPKRVEFRLPISPTQEFFSLVRFFNFALRRLNGQHYRDARLLIVVGDHCDLDAVRRANRWSEAFNIDWERVPDAIFNEFHWAGTANWRLSIPAGDADVFILSDADTVLLRDIDPLLTEFPLARPTVSGHMAHFPPPLGDKSAAPSPASPAFWPWLFALFDIPWPIATHRYSMDADGSLPMSPAYFNLGFVAMNAKALATFAAQVTETTRRVTAATGSFMRCQIALTIMAYRAGIDIGTLPAAFNAANDIVHLGANALTADQIRVLHFLRMAEVSREELQPHLIDGLLSRSLTNPANIALQDLVREYRTTLK
ncbi:MAG TPA: hypothetical protein VGF53_14205 [Pseudolabrys sp.]|jgi:hypothetical protein